MGIRKKKTFIDQAAEFAGSIGTQVESAIDTARDTARETAGPVLADARAKATPLLVEGKALATEKATHGRDALLEATGKRRKSGGKLRKLVVVGAITGIAGVVAKKALDRSSSADRQQSSTPASPAHGATASAVGIADLKFDENTAAPLSGGAAPDGFKIKGNKDSGKYHTPSSPWYEKTVAEVWFRTEDAAEKAGFVRAG